MSSQACLRSNLPLVVLYQELWRRAVGAAAAAQYEGADPGPAAAGAVDG